MIARVSSWMLDEYESDVIAFIRQSVSILVYFRIFCVCFYVYGI